MTITAMLNGQSIGTGSNKGEGLFATKLTLQTGTTAYVFTPRLTNGADSYNPKAEVIIWFTTSSFSITAAQAVKQLKSTARYVSIKPGRENADVVIRDSSLEPNTGGYLYCWCEVPLVVTAQTLDVNIVELP